MVPQLRESHRLLVDIARRTPATGEMVVLSNGTGLLINRTEIVPDGDHPPRPQLLLSANPDSPVYTCLAEEARGVDKVP